MVEILIVVVILGILAAIVVPQFAPARTEANTAAIHSDLKTIRMAIQVYKVHHNDTLPGTGKASFVQALTDMTDAAGAVGADFGPYIKDMPANPFNKLRTVEVESGTGNLGGGDHGWHFDLLTGAFHPDTPGHTKF